MKLMHTTGTRGRGSEPGTDRATSGGEPPASVDYFAPHIREAVAGCGPRQAVLGVDTDGQVVVEDVLGGTAVVAGPGLGTTSTLQMLTAQLVRQAGTTVIALDHRGSGLTALEGIAGIHLVSGPQRVVQMRAAISWVAGEVRARREAAARERGRSFDLLVLVLDEGVAFTAALRDQWKKHRAADAPVEDPVLQELAAILAGGRAVDVTVLAGYQDLRAHAVGSPGLPQAFGQLMLSGLPSMHWRILGGTPPLSGAGHRGRMTLARGSEPLAVQVPYIAPGLLRPHLSTLRHARGYRPDGVLTGPPSTIGE